MSNLPGENYHAAKSLEIHNKVASARSTATHQAMYDMACAQNLATLALAYEKRTANLIALADLTMHGGLHPDYDMETIYNRLGLGDTNA